MKKILKFLLILIVVVIVGVGGFLFYLSQSEISSYEKSNIAYEVVSTPEKVDRGRKLGAMLCAGCHMNFETGKLSGHHMTDAPPEFGMIYSANITQDEQHGIANYTDAELKYLLRTGIKKNGQYAPPYMAKLPHLADADMEAIIAFLRSDDPMVQADPVPAMPCEPSVLTKFLCKVAFKPLPYSDEAIAMPDSNDQVAVGKYLVYNLECFSCHSADFTKNNYQDPEKSLGYCGGGNKPLNNDGQVVLTANITPDVETGIGGWTEEQFIKAVKYGMKDGEAALQYPMQPYNRLTDQEAAAIFAYLKTIPAIKNKVERVVY